MKKTDCPCCAVLVANVVARPHTPEELSQHHQETGGRVTCDISTWGPVCGRGIAYVDQGAAVASGTKGVSRKISTGRKQYRGMSSDSSNVQ